MNKSSDLLAGIEMIYSLAKEKSWTSDQLNSQVQSFINDWKDRRSSDLSKRHGGDLDAI
tara:strand:+ start:3557 stop:3733 length:177 start_codon:yes stop_codon:yes gene_type:complete